MRILKRILVCLIVVIIVIILVYLLLPKSGGYLKKVSAKLYVNGDYVDDTAIMYWYNRKGQGPARFSLPLITTLKALGCEIEGDETQKVSDIKVRVNDMDYLIIRNGSGSDLYRNNELILPSVARPQKVNRGSLYLGDYNYKKVLEVLGFDQVLCDVNEEERTIKLYAIL